MMRKLMLFAVLVCLAAAPAMALDFAAKSFYVQGEVTFPMGDFGDVATLGYGGGLGLLVPHNDMLDFGLEASYVTYSMEDVPGGDASASMIPVLFLVHYNLSSAPMYLLGGAGVAFSSSKVEFDDPDLAIYEFDDSSSDFNGALGLGFNATPMLFFEGRYNFISDANQVSAHIGYKF